jgi:hypothetical protein
MGFTVESSRERSAALQFFSKTIATASVNRHLGLVDVSRKT